MGDEFNIEEMGWMPPEKSPQACDRAMVTHSTELAGFSANQILQAARADLAKRQRNDRMKADRKEAKRKFGAEHARAHFGPPESYAFEKGHVTFALGPQQLIELAIAEPHIGVQTGIAATMRLYRSVAAMREALALAETALASLPPDPVESPLPIPEC